jgi:cAMP-binding proteins - catabolite gene activator and regulatory subunit of cAMP-dependent protein kinases
METENLTLCPLFASMTQEEIKAVLSPYMYSICSFKKGQNVLTQGQRYSLLYILLEGSVHNSMSQNGDKNITIEVIQAPDVIAPAIFYSSQNTIPVDVVAKTDVKILPLQRGDFTFILQRNAKVLNNFIQIISNRISVLYTKVRALGFATIKSNIAQYLCEIMQEKGSRIFEIQNTQQELSDIFGVTRPALAKAISEMITEGLIESKGKQFKIINPVALLILSKNSSL